MTIRRPFGVGALALGLAGCGGGTIADQKGGLQNDAAPGGDAAALDGSGGGGANSEGGANGDGGSDANVARLHVSKIDLLFMIDNSASMGDKQALLAQAVPDMVNRLINPNCLDASGTAQGVSTNGTCPTGQKAEFAPVHDMHIGVVSSSLGNRGSNYCNADTKNPVNPSLNSHQDDQGHLLNRGGPTEAPLPDEGADNFLAWLPPGGLNTGEPLPPGGVAALGDTPTFNADFTNLISGVHEFGCGYEHQQEAWYRFLVQPDPYDHVVTGDSNSGHAALAGVDSTILQQRHDFLRPDSLLAVIAVTDEDEETIDPMALQGGGWAYMETQFPTSRPPLASPKPTAACAMNPNDPSCTSCFYANTDTNCAGAGGSCNPAGGANPACYSYETNDQPNVRTFHMKQRFGVDVQFPVSRYIRGLTKGNVPDRDHEHFMGAATYTGEGVDANNNPNANCRNPIFAQNLPTDSATELCNLQPGPRTPDLVFYGLIVGVPHQLLQAQPGDPECSAGTPAADCPQKTALADADWMKITGKDPENYDFTGADPHMVESITPRTLLGLPPPTAADNADPINGREVDTGLGDQEYACVFDFLEPKDCTDPNFAAACDCEQGYTGPLCQQSGAACAGANPPAACTTQTRGKAYPGIRELVVAHALGPQAIVSSICPIHTVDNPSKTDPVYGYRPAANAIINRLKNALSVP